MFPTPPLILPKPVTYIGTGLASSDLTVGVHANVLANDFGVFWAGHPVNITLNDNGLSGDENINITGISFSAGGKTLTSNAATHTFTSTGTTPQRARSFAFRDAENGIVDKSSGSGTGAGFTLPSRTVLRPGSAAIFVLFFEDLDDVVAGAGLNGSTLIAQNQNTSRQWDYYYWENLNAFPGGAITWATSALYAWYCGIIR